MTSRKPSMAPPVTPTAADQLAVERLESTLVSMSERIKEAHDASVILRTASSLALPQPIPTTPDDESPPDADTSSDHVGPLENVVHFWDRYPLWFRYTIQLILVLGLLLAIFLVGWGNIPEDQTVMPEHGLPISIIPRSITPGSPYVRDVSSPREIVDVKFRGFPSMCDEARNYTIEFATRDNNNNQSVVRAFPLDIDCDRQTFEVAETLDMSSYPAWTKAAHAMVVLRMSSDSPKSVGCLFDVHAFGTTAKYRATIGLIILAFVYIGIFSEKLYRTVCALLGSLTLIAVIVGFGARPSMGIAIGWVDVNTLGLLAGMMIMVDLLAETGAFQALAIWALDVTKGRAFALLVVMSTCCGLVSSFLPNVTAVMLLVPVTLEVCRIMDTDPRPFVIAEAMMSNIGGTITMVGDPPNLVIANAIPTVQFGNFFTNVGVGAILTLPFVFGMWRFLFPELYQKPAVKLDTALLRKQHPIKDPVLLRGLLGLSAAIVILMFGQSVHSVDVSWISMLGAVCGVILSNSNDAAKIIGRVDWDCLVYLCALFIMMEACHLLGCLDTIGRGLADGIRRLPPSQHLPAAVMLILWVCGSLSAFLDNTALTITMIRVVKVLARDLGVDLIPIVWALSFGACLGGNITIVGSAANVVGVGICNLAGYPIMTKNWVKIGLPVVLVQLGVLSLYLYLRYLM